MNAVLKKFDNIKNSEVYKILLYIFLLIPFLKAPYLDCFAIVNRIYDILFIISSLLLYYFSFSKKSISKFSIMVTILMGILAINCIMNRNLTFSTIKFMIEMINITLLVHLGLEEDCKPFLKALMIRLGGLIFINFLSIIIFPKGLYYDSVSKMTDNYFLGMDNGHFKYFSLFFLIYYIYCYIYKKNSKSAVFIIIVSIISILIRKSGSALIGSAIILFYFLIYKKVDKIKVFKLSTFLILYIFLYFGTIFFNIQRLFSFVFVNILGKDLTFTKRTTIWSNTIKSISNRLWFGLGKIDAIYALKEIKAVSAHNLFLQIMLEGGLIYLSAFLFVIYFALRKLKQYNNKLVKTLIIFVFTAFIIGLVEVYTLGFLLMLLAICYDIKYLMDNLSKNTSNVNVVVIGGNHHNTLGVIRMLGEKDIMPNLIVTNENKYCYVTKSKYVNDFDIVEEDETSIKKILKEKYSNGDEKAILIPTSDFAALFIDKNLNELQKNFITPSINNKQGEIEKYMDKYEQYELAKQNKINMAETFEIDLTKKIDINKYPLPCILKPQTSALGCKADIKICNTTKELENDIKELKELHYQNVILQEYINYDYECCIIGCCYDNEVVVPGIMRKIRIYPLKRGSTCYSKIIKKENINVDISKIVKILKSLSYRGLFDIEVFVKDDNVYLNEINFRNSGTSYAYTHGGVNLVCLWVSLMLGKNIEGMEKNTNEEYYFEDDVLELKQLFDKNISLKTYIKSFINAKAYLLLNGNDIMVTLFWKNIYAIARRLHKKGSK